MKIKYIKGNLLDAPEKYILHGCNAQGKMGSGVAAANERQRKLATDFMGMLMNLGFSTRCFDPAGQDDIGGGCGQLWFVQDWMKNNPDLAKPSVGRMIPIVHAPRCVV